jgi:hypothetical protein
VQKGAGILLRESRWNLEVPMGQGQILLDRELRRIVSLLSTTDMSIGEIAERMQCSRSTVASINKRFNVRNYNGRRKVWETAPTVQSEPLVGQIEVHVS